MTRWAYNLFMWALVPLLRLRLARRGQAEPGYLQAVDERFGRYSTTPASSTSLAPQASNPGPLIWIHAVSLGETRTAALLLAALRAQLPGMRLLLTNGTATGRAEGAQLLRPGDLQVWQPWDTRSATRRFLAHFQPSLGLLIETEVWPNLSAACQASGVPLVLVNARLSEKSMRQALRLAWLARPAFGALTAVWAQSRADAQRLRQIGAPEPQVLGNLKFDAQPDAQQLAQGKAWRARNARPVLFLASAREGEEAALLRALSALSALQTPLPDVQWLIVPRHPQRFAEVAALIESQGFKVSRRSQWLDGPAPDDASPRTLWLGDSLGEMALYYGLADVALLGGSFEPFGGQNLIEAAACACPVVMGPHTFNFTQAAELAVAAGGAQRVASLAQGVETALALVQAPAQRAVMANAAMAFAHAHRGAARQTAEAVLRLLRQQ
jgi:3-deoxy-D-manno-octulosonic-acid transferase